MVCFYSNNLQIFGFTAKSINTDFSHKILKKKITICLVRVFFAEEISRFIKKFWITLKINRFLAIKTITKCVRISKKVQRKQLVESIEPATNRLPLSDDNALSFYAGGQCADLLCRLEVCYKNKVKSTSHAHFQENEKNSASEFSIFILKNFQRKWKNNPFRPS